MPALKRPGLKIPGINRGNPLAPILPARGGTVRDVDFPDEPTRATSGGGPLFSGTTQEYYSKVNTLLGSAMIAYWPGWESSGTVASSINNGVYDGTYTGVTLGQAGIGDGRTCPLYDGVNDFTNVYSAALAAAFNAPAGTAAIWMNPTSWTGAVTDDFMQLAADSSNQVLFRKTDNTVSVRYTAAGTAKLVSIASLTVLKWYMFAITWDKVADQVKVYVDGTQSGATQTALGLWSGALASTLCVIGAFNSASSNSFDGYLAHAVLCNAALPAATIAKLATV